jgi:hypothetical protein
VLIVQRYHQRDDACVEALAQHALGVDSFFAWSSPREPVAT